MREGTGKRQRQSIRRRKDRRKRTKHWSKRQSSKSEMKTRKRIERSRRNPGGGTANKEDAEDSGGKDREVESVR